MQFDRAMQPVSLGDRVVLGSSVDGTVFALDAHTGRGGVAVLHRRAQSVLHRHCGVIEPLLPVMTDISTR